MRKKSTVPVFGEKGIAEVEWTGELPSPAFGPYYTRKVYRFRTDKNPRLVDKRDLPQLVKEAGRENLRGLPTEPKPKPKAKTKTKADLPAHLSAQAEAGPKPRSETKPKAED